MLLPEVAPGACDPKNTYIWGRFGSRSAREAGRKSTVRSGGLTSIGLVVNDSNRKSIKMLPGMQSVATIRFQTSFFSPKITSLAIKKY